MEQHLTAISQLRKGLAGLGDVLSQLENQTVRTSRTVHWAAKGAVADFDRLDRLNFGGGGSSTLTVTTKLSGELMKLWELVGKINLDPLRQGFDKLAGALGNLGQGSFGGLHWAWSQILEPMSRWPLDQPMTGFLETLNGKLQSLTAVTQTARPGLTWLWESWLRPMGAWTGQTVQTALDALKTRLTTLGGATGSLEGLTAGLTGVTQAADGLKAQNGPLTTLFSGLTTLAQSLGGAVDATAGKLSGLYPAFQTAGNAAIGAANTALSGIEGAVNGMSAALKALAIDIPAWVPLVGGKKLSFDLGSVSLPRIPQLARGAVLPANKPFLAMVGDQKNGTNIEAPLATIQEALSNVLGASLPGQQAANELLAQILTAIQGITVGDDTIGRAARRYEQRMAVLGGAL